MKKAIERVLLTAMSFQRSKAEDKITELGDNITEHALKIMLYPETSFVEGWRKEIRAWYFSCLRMGSNLKKGKSFKASDYYKFLANPILVNGSKHLAIQQELVKVKMEGHAALDVSDDEVLLKLQEFYQILAQDLGAIQTQPRFDTLFHTLS